MKRTFFISILSLLLAFIYSKYKVGDVMDIKALSGGIPQNSMNVFKQRRVNSQQTDSVELKNKKDKKDDKTSLIKKLKTVAVAFVSSFATGLTVFAFMFQQNSKIKADNEKIKADNEAMKADNQHLDELNKNLENQNGRLQERINSIILPRDIDNIISEKINEFNSTQLQYSPTKAIECESISNKIKNYNPISILPEIYEKTTNRSDAKPLVYPKFEPDKDYIYSFPSSSEIRLTTESSDFSSIPRTLTNISESYADALVWNNDKIARDLMQNFYDGHGQTLDGVKLKVTKNDDGKYKVRIEGKSTFSPDKAILLGESSKRENNKAAGNYGEGLKMVVLKLLKEKGAENVDIASSNWNVNWQLQDSGLGKKVLAYQLDKVPAFDGNYIEFDTDNINFIKAVINSFDKFYHYNNPAFTCPDFENDILALKLVDEKSAGKFFINGQAFEIDGSYDGMKSMNIGIKKKPPLKYNGDFIFDPSRDRTSLNKENLEALGSWVISKENMSKDDAVKLIHSLQKYWDIGTMHNNHQTIGTSFIYGLFKGAYDRNDLNIQFPSDKYVADSWRVSEDVRNMYIQAGYKVCSSIFQNIGMRSIEELVQETRKHTPVNPTVAEKNKILILKEAINLLSSVLKEDNLFTDDEIDTKIFIYDKNTSKEDKAYKDVAGEAIVAKGKSLGFWLERNYINKASFSEAFATSLHELTHKYGGDESSRFSYKLTDVMQKVFAAINSNPNLAIQLKVLEKAWEAQK